MYSESEVTKQRPGPEASDMADGAARADRGEDFWIRVYRNLQNHRAPIAITFAVTFVVALLLFALGPQRYEAWMDVQASPDVPSSGQSPLSSLSSGVASLLLSPEGSVSPFELYRITIFSHDVAAKLAADPTVMQHIYSAEWDPKHNRYHHPYSLIYPIKAMIFGIFDQAAWHSPSADRLQEYIRRRVEVTQVQSTGVYRISYQDRSRSFALHFLSELAVATDQTVRETVLARNAAFLKYLTNQLQHTTNSDIRSSLIGLVAERQRIDMLASANVSYAAETVDGPSGKPWPVEPDVKVSLLLSFVIALLVSGGTLFVITLFEIDLNRVIVAVRDRWRRSKMLFRRRAN